MFSLREKQRVSVGHRNTAEFEVGGGLRERESKLSLSLIGSGSPPPNTRCWGGGQGAPLYFACLAHEVAAHITAHSVASSMCRSEV